MQGGIEKMLADTNKKEADFSIFSPKTKNWFSQPHLELRLWYKNVL